MLQGLLVRLQSNGLQPCCGRLSEQFEAHHAKSQFVARPPPAPAIQPAAVDPAPPFSALVEHAERSTIPTQAGVASRDRRMAEMKA